ncbi:MAG TPA: lysylphosphatidylglycerol synthase domain-containing protein [Baekduia sp.]|uniref:lysylphosphatidylglycerol synthase domain-containing protein n=1 Tax=Baekduia sp. TaxID=2600305 RepID=UPI002B9F854B|nr:lysylphosphatidylglycerol synthase domain-containing protein [Baekduia sp.]HMJ34706.1 lysylphosphatidylglycerol synthase domain-containing protein [Baekduia sp.]
MRIALVSPYSWTYPGGVTRHIEALQGQFDALGHDVRVLAPVDPPDRQSARRHRGAVPQEREIPDWVVPLGRTIGFGANGAVSNLSSGPDGVARLRHELRHGGYDVVHLHEPVVPTLAWDALMYSPSPLVGTFHCYSSNALSNNVAVGIGARRRLNRLKVRIAVSEAAAWTGERFFGGRYRIIPNGVAVPEHIALGEADAVSAERPLRIVFVGQAVERKGLPVLLRAFEALREHVPAQLTLVGATSDEIEPLLLDGREGITVLGKVDDATKFAALQAADVLAAPSLGGESFGMVLTEAFAAGTPVVASDIAGYAGVVRDGVDGVLVPRGDAAALGAALRSLALDPPRRDALARAAAESAQQYAWPRVAAQVLHAYEDAIAVPEPEGAGRRLAVRIGAAPADLQPSRPAWRIPSIEPVRPRARARRPVVAALRRLAMGVVAAAILTGSFFALQRIGLDRIGHSLLHATPPWVLFALGLMCASMVVRAVSWHAILKAALPTAPRPRLRDALQGTMIGVLMSATLPARLGEPARAMIVARRIGRPREGLPVVLGTIVSQTLVNILALVILGCVMFQSVPVFHSHQSGLIAFALLPLMILGAVLGAPALLRGTRRARSARVRAWAAQARDALQSVRDGLLVFRQPRLGFVAVSAQLLAWVVQWLSCYVLLVAFGLDDRAGIGAAAAVLFAVNVSAVLPATPSNLGVFQAACVFVLHKGYGVSVEDALGYGIILQAVEIATAFVMGAPALITEGVSWRDVRLRAMHAAPVELPPLPRRDGVAEVEA